MACSSRLIGGLLVVCMALIRARKVCILIVDIGESGASHGIAPLAFVGCRGGAGSEIGRAHV